MIYNTWHSVADNGRVVIAEVSLLDTDDALHRWRGEVWVDYTTLTFTYFDSRIKAETWADGIVEAYLKAHKRPSTGGSDAETGEAVQS